MSFRSIGSDGLYASEREILELWDAGLSKEEIIDRGFKAAVVNRSIYAFAAADDCVRQVRDFANGSRMLAAAVNAAGGHR
jgi:hypothetical protein